MSKYTPVLAVVVVFGGLGTALLLTSHAATPVANIETENGTVSAAATKVSDSTASGSQAVKFGTGSGGGGGGSGEADACTTQLVLPSAKPVATNSGVPSGTTLTNYTGPTNITTAGTVINAAHITSALTISANNVTIQNSLLNPTSVANIIVINIANGVTGTKIIHDEITVTASSANGGYEGVNSFNAGSATIYTFICGNYFHNFENDITTGPNTIAQSNYITAMQNNAGDADADGIEDYWGGNNRFWGNNIMAYGTNGTSTSGINSALNITATGKNIDDVQINGNWLGGGGGTLDLDQQTFNGSTGLATNVSVTNNIWYRSPPPTYGAVSSHASTIVSTWTNNKYDDGTVINKP